MAKKKDKTSTKEKTRQREIAALWFRLADLARGAAGNDHTGGYDEDQDGGLAFEMGIPEWVRFLLAAKAVFCASSGDEPEKGMAVPHAFELWNLPEFSETLDRAAEHLHSQGARAE